MSSASRSLCCLFVCRSVGVSNFGVQHLEGLRKAGRPTPSVNQIELHPQMRKQDIVDYCRQHGIVVMGYSPLAKAQRMNEKKLMEVAKKYEYLLNSMFNRLSATTWEYVEGVMWNKKVEGTVGQLRYS